MNPKEQLLLEKTIGKDAVRLQVRTRTCIDVGLWWRQRPLWLCLTDSELVILAVARRKHVERLALSSIQKVHYSASGGELVISSKPELRFPRLKMAASAALDVIDFIQKHSSQTTPTP